MKYSLVGVDGNAFSVMGYTAKALRSEGLGDLVNKMQNEAMSGDYDHLLCICCDYVEIANNHAESSGYTDDEDMFG